MKERDRMKITIECTPAELNDVELFKNKSLPSGKNQNITDRMYQAVYQAMMTVLQASCNKTSNVYIDEKELSDAITARRNRREHTLFAKEEQ